MNVFDKHLKDIIIVIPVQTHIDYYTERGQRLARYIYVFIHKHTQIHTQVLILQSSSF